MKHRAAPDATKPTPPDEARAFAVVLGGTLLLILVAFGLGLFLKTAPLSKLSWSMADAAAGLAATAPLLLILFWFMNARAARIAAFRNLQLDFFELLGFRFTPSRILLLSLAAGLSEELLFRGVLQSWLAGLGPLWLAILAPNIVFGALHGRTASYAVVAGIVGVWLGTLFALTENLLAPIVAHAVYDAVALDVTRRALERRALGRSDC